MSGALPSYSGQTKKAEKMLEKASPNALFNEQALRQTKQNLLEISEEEFSLEQLQEIQRQSPMMIAKLKFLMVSFQQSKMISSKLAGLLSAALKDFDIAREQNTITKENKERLESLLGLAKQHCEELVSTKQIDPLISNASLT
ncbi:MAG: hypothetical protein WBD50_07710 [Candidatus Rhabdochlamydia sp.]